MNQKREREAAKKRRNILLSVIKRERFGDSAGNGGQGGEGKKRPSRCFLLGSKRTERFEVFLFVSFGDGGIKKNRKESEKRGLEKRRESLVQDKPESFLFSFPLDSFFLF